MCVCTVCKHVPTLSVSLANIQPIILVFPPFLLLFPNLVHVFPAHWSKMNQPICHPPVPPLYFCHFHLLFICRLCIIPLMVPPLSLMLNVASNCFHPCATALYFPTFTQSTHIFLDVTSRRFKSLYPSPQLHGTSHGLKSKKNCR